MSLRLLYLGLLAASDSFVDGMFRFLEAVNFPKPRMFLFTDFFSGRELWNKWGQERIDEGIEVEPKLNGFRAKAIKSDGKIQILIEDSKKDRSGQYPDLVKALDRMGSTFELDGDLAIEAQGERIPRIQLMTLIAEPPKLRQNERIVYTIFDIVNYQGEDLTGLPFDARRDKLLGLKGKLSDGVQVVGGLAVKDKKAFLAAVSRMSRQAGSEGVVVKALKSPYPKGEGTDDWAKLKNVLEIKAKVLKAVPNKAGGWNYDCGVTAGEGDYRRMEDGLVNMGRTFTSKIKSEPGDVVTLMVHEVIQTEGEPGELAYLGATVLDVDRSRKEPYSASQIVDMAKRARVHQLNPKREPLQEGRADQGHTKPIFGSPGGKKLLAETIVKLIPEHGIYVEPFVGGGAVFWKKKPSEVEVINDLDPEIAAAYRVVKKYKPEQIRASAAKFNWTSSKERWRQMVKGGGVDGPNRFLRFMYAIRNSMGESRMSFAYVTNMSNRPPAFDSSLDAQHERLQRMTIKNQDFRALLRQHDSSDAFLYLDPPYTKSGRGNLRAPHADLSLEDFAAACKGIKKAKYLASYADTPEVKKAFKDQHIRKVKVKRIFDARASEAIHIDTELLISNYPIRLAPGTHQRYTESGELVEIEILEAELTSKGEEPGSHRQDFMAQEPKDIPGTFRVWHHWRGIPEKDKDKSEEALMRGPGHSLHVDMRLYWGRDYLEGFTMFTPGNSRSTDKLAAGKPMACDLKSKQPVIWNNIGSMDGRLFEPGEVGNVAGKDTWGKMFLWDEGKFLPLRIRNARGRRYYELALRFDRHPRISGIYSISEEAAAGAAAGGDDQGKRAGFIMQRLDTTIPFAARHQNEKKYEDEIRSMPDWQIQDEDRVKKFLGG